MAVNNVILSGNLCNEVALEGEGTQRRVRNTLAVQRYYDKEKGAKTDFIPIVAFGGTAEYLANRATVGSNITVVGRLQVDSRGEGEERRTFYSVVINNVDIHTKKAAKDDSAGAEPAAEDEVTNQAVEDTVPDEENYEGLPF